MYSSAHQLLHARFCLLGYQAMHRGSRLINMSHGCQASLDWLQAVRHSAGSRRAMSCAAFCVLMALVVTTPAASQADTPSITAGPALDSPDSSAAAGSSPAPSSLPPVPQAAEEWKLGRATYYGAPETISRAYDPTRGQGSFGILGYGSCGYTNSDGTIPFARTAVAAAADQNEDFPGSCGRCYRVRCKSGLILDNDLTPLNIYAPYMTYLPALNSTVTDSFGRSWPGNPDEAAALQFTRCWNNTGSEELVVRVIDSCPCTQVLKAGDPGVAANETRRQEWCCGGIQHMDLSYDAFELLAHPVYGMLMFEYQPVSCDYYPSTLPFTPGFIDKYEIYNASGTTPGWGWIPYNYANTRWGDAGEGPSGGNATCVQVSPGGGVSFRCRDCSRPGYQPFANTTAIEVWLKPNSNSADPSFSSTPTGQPPALKVYLLNEESKKYCNGELYLNTTTPELLDGDWYKFTINLTTFRCDYPGAFPQDIDNISFENPNERNAYFCLGRLALVKGNYTGPTSYATPSPAPADNATTVGEPSSTGGNSTLPPVEGAIEAVGNSSLGRLAVNENDTASAVSPGSTAGGLRL